MPRMTPDQRPSMLILNPDGTEVTRPDVQTWPISSGYAVAMSSMMIVTKSSGNLQVAATGGDVYGVLVGFLSTQSDAAFTSNYKPASTAAYGLVIPFSTGIILGLMEDGVGDLITTADTHVDIVAPSITSGGGTNVYRVPYNTINVLDSSSAATSAGSLKWQILGLANIPGNNRVPGDTTSKLRWLVKPIAAAIQA